MRTLWITGAGGVLGDKLVRAALARDAYDRVHALGHTPTPPAHLNDLSAGSFTWAALDIGDRAAVQAAAHDAPPDVIVNPGAMTNVDACESHREAAWRANADGPRWLAEVARDRRARLLHVSTDYVFPGDEAQPGPYGEDDATRAINYYGESKLGGERAIAEVCGVETPYLMARTALVYGLVPGGRANFVTWLAGELRAGRRVRIVRDQFNTPTLADDLAEVLLWLAEHRATGIYHTAGPDLVGRHEWALAIAEQFSLDASLIDWVTTAELAQPAPRPRFSGLRCDRLAADVASAPDGAPTLRGVSAGLCDIPWLG
jgi:dTDP-4-dehydrorhamnose reductase